MIDSDKKISSTPRTPNTHISAVVLLVLAGMSAFAVFADQDDPPDQELQEGLVSEVEEEAGSIATDRDDIGDRASLDLIDGESGGLASDDLLLAPDDTGATDEPVTDVVTGEYIKFTVKIQGIKKMDGSYLHLILTSSSDNKNQVRSRKVNADGTNILFEDCSSENVHPKCGKTDFSFESVQVDIEYELVVCHTNFPSQDSCRRGGDGQFVSAGKAKSVTPSRNQDTYTLSLKDAY